ncbi:RING finger protein 122 isoform X2 [Channa argus]|uniref:RING finger protein 122 isoform X2 n=1 Tax=Channa argus TaxID=215402 RepID=UPI003520B10C
MLQLGQCYTTSINNNTVEPVAAWRSEECKLRQHFSFLDLPGRTRALTGWHITPRQRSPSVHLFICRLRPFYRCFCLALFPLLADTLLLAPRCCHPCGLLGDTNRIPLARTPSSALMHPFQWCNGCFCGLGLVYSNKSCTMPPITFQDLPLNIYMVIFGTGIFVFILSLIFCCYFISKLRHQAQSERFGYREVVLKGDPKRLNLHGTCAVCLEDFKVKDELGVLPCQHAFHRKCLVKWLEVRCVCPMCNKPIAGPPEQHHSIGTLLDELV